MGVRFSSPTQAIAYTDLDWGWSSAPDHTGVVVPTAEVDLGPAAMS